ncbi:MAG: hypothetical protein JWO38_1950 [Gemmataceae bacterium]|nr:hypothetical protein [Gemmataceae bacterium]
MPTVHLRINDTATAKPTPVRLRISGPDGTFYPPFGRFAEFATGRNEDVGGHLRVGREKWCYTDGSCEIKLPAGVPLRVQATKGPEYRPLDETVTLGTGQMALRFAIGRWSAVRADGWHPGDTRCHFIPPHSALLEAAAEDVDVVNLLASAQPLPSLDGRVYPTAPHLAAFSGQAAALESHGRLVAINTLNTHPVLGRVGLLYSHRPVFPLSFGGDDDTDDWSVCDWCDQCHRKGGLTVWTDAFREGAGLGGGEALVAAVLGKIDAIEFDAHPRQQALIPWVYRLWNAGFPVPLVGGSGKDSNTVALGAVRTYARVPAGEPFTYKGWIEAVRKGRTFVTNGPLLTLDVGGHGPGTIAGAPAGPLTVTASAASLHPFERLDVVVNGEVVGSTTATEGGGWAARLEVVCTAPESGWVAARVVGGSSPLLPPGGIAFAHTSCLPIRAGGQPLPRRPADIGHLAAAVRGVGEWAEQYGRYAVSRWRDQLVARCGEALRQLTPAAQAEVPG